MQKISSFEQPDAEFLAHAGTVYTQCNDHSADWKVDETRLSTLSVLLDGASSAYRTNLDPATHNRVTSTHKKQAFGELKHFLSLFVDYLEGNLSVPDEALALMQLRPRQRHASAPLPPPGEAPAVSVVKQHDEMTVYVSRREHGQPTQSTTRKAYHGFKLRWRFAGDAHWQTEISTRLHLTLHFDREDAGKSVELLAAWINPRLVEGPWSESVVEVVG
jgi:hypothetical protein